MFNRPSFCTEPDSTFLLHFLSATAFLSHAFNCVLFTSSFFARYSHRVHQLLFKAILTDLLRPGNKIETFSIQIY